MIFVLIIFVIDLSLYIHIINKENKETISLPRAQPTIIIPERDTELETTNNPTNTSLIIVESSTSEDDETETSSQSEEETSTEDEENLPPCLANYNLTEHTIIFYYQNEPHSNNMKPIIQELESIYDFYWNSELWNSAFNSCFGLTGATPTFVCAGTKEKTSGELSKAELADFASKC